MALIIEDGSIVPGADSYATAAELVTYAANYGFTVPATEPAQEAILRRAALQMNAMNWKGNRVSPSQSLAWPRSNVCVDGEVIPNNLIPARIQYGQMALAAEIYAEDSAPVNQTKGAVVKEKVDVIEVAYADVSAHNQFLLPAAPDRQSSVQFVDYLVKRGLFVVRA